MSKMTCAEQPFRRCKRALAHVKKKSKIVTCAEHPFRQLKRAAAHAKKEKPFDVSCITI